jgi:hypothetical protein
VKGKKMDAMTRRVALVELRKLKASEAEYRADREEWYRSGDGRSPKYWTNPETGRRHNYGGKGYTFPYCEHGSSRWTDYDNICGPCEDGYSVYQLAIWSAQEKVHKVNERIDWLVTAPASLRHTDMHRELLDWALSPIK